MKSLCLSALQKILEGLKEIWDDIKCKAEKRNKATGILWGLTFHCMKKVLMAFLLFLEGGKSGRLCIEIIVSVLSKAIVLRQHDSILISSDFKHIRTYNAYKDLLVCFLFYSFGTKLLNRTIEKLKIGTVLWLLIIL